MTDRHNSLNNLEAGQEQVTELLVLGRFAQTSSDPSLPKGSNNGVDNSTGRDVVITRVNTAKYSSGTILRLEHQASLLVDVRVESLSSMLAVGRQSDTLYLVQDHVPGKSLARRLEQRVPLSLSESLAVGRSVLRGLQAMHGCGVVHGEIQPRSVVTDSQGPVKRVTLTNLGPPKSLEHVLALLPGPGSPGGTHESRASGLH